MAQPVTQNIAGFSDFLDDTCLDTRAKWREFSKNEIFKPRYNLSLREQKELAMDRLKVIAENKVFSVFDFGTNPVNIFANHEMAGQIDGSMATKLTVQLNLFGGTLFSLGTERHLSVLKGIDDFSTIGCFALTELGYGNNAVQMGTTAHYDQKSQTFNIHSPTVLSQKYWITNGAYHSNYAVVFAQLIMPGNVNEGVHGFLVRIRNQDGSPVEGVFIEDMGAKFGLNGVDNGRLKFTNVKISREGLLNKFSDVSPEGVFTSKIKNKRQRFLTVADRLLSGRICIASMINQASKLGLITTIRYGNVRMAMGPDGLSNTPIAEFGLFQNNIYPLLARTIILNTGFNTIKNMYQENKLKNLHDPQFIVCLCCAVKPIITWNTRDVGTTVTERVGGQGYLSVNRVSEILPFAHSGITAEGDNGVLMQKVAKELSALMQQGKYSTPAPAEKSSSYNFKPGHLQSLIDLLRIRERKMSSDLLKQTQQKLGQGNTIYQVWMREDNDLVQSFARAFGERILSEYANQNIKGSTPQLQSILNIYLNLHMNLVVLRDLGWYIYNDFITTEQAKVINATHKVLIKDVHKIALQTVNSFGVPEHLLTAPISQNYEVYNDGKNEGEVFTPKL